MPQTGTPETIAAITRDDLVAFHQRNFVPNNAILAVVGDVTAEEAFEGVKRVFGDWERRAVPADTFTPPPDPTRRVVVVNKPDAVQTEVRVGHVGIRRNHPDYMALNLAHPDSRRRGRQSPAPGPADGARPDLRRAGRHGHAPGERRLRGVDQHAVGRDGRSAAADRGRVLAPAARAGQRAGAGRREGVSDRQLSADDRDAGCDRDPGAQRALLRAADRGAAVVPRARQRRHAGRHRARGAFLSPARSAVGRAGRQRRGVYAAAVARRLRHLRDHRGSESGSDGRGLQASVTSGNDWRPGGDSRPAGRSGGTGGAGAVLAQNSGVRPARAISSAGRSCQTMVRVRGRCSTR